MEICHPSPSNGHANMSLLDQIFGTDGRNKKDEGIWNWVKNQKVIKNHKSKNKHQLLTRSNTTTPTTTEENNINKRASLSTIYTSSSSSYPASSTTSCTSYACSPTTPTFSSSFIPPQSSSPSPSQSSTHSSSSNTLSGKRCSTPALSIPDSPTSTLSSSSKSSHPVDYPRQKARSTFGTPSLSSASDFSLGPIKRSTSSGSAPSLPRHHNASHNHNRANNEIMLDNHQGRLVRARSPVLMDDISETSTTVFSSGESFVESSSMGTRVPHRPQRWSSPSEERRAEMRRARKDGWWWE